MSYILDALQRAEAERERGGVPGLNARPVPPSAAPTVLSTRQRAAWSVVAVALAGTVAAGLWAWYLPVAVPVAEPAPQGQAVPSAAPPAVIPLTVVEVAAPPVARVVAPKPVPTTQPPTPAPIQPTAAASSPAAASLALLSELPQDIRQQIPALAINGAVYSDNPSQRLLLVNGQVLSQGSLVAPDLTLDRIGANSSEFSFRGTRFRVAH